MVRLVATALVPLLALASSTSAQAEAPDALDVEQIDALMRPYGPETGGAALAVVRDGELIFAKGYGSANLEQRAPITPRTVFYLCSVGKQFTAFAVALLAAEGRLSLDDVVQQRFPELAHLERPITVRQLVHHTSGIRNFSDLLAMAGHREGDLMTQEDALRVIFAQRELNFAPGTEHLYSNSGYVLLAALVERVTGERFSDFMRERVLEPLGMEHTFVGDSYDLVIPGRADSYEVASDGRLREVVNPYSVYGSGGIFSTVEDLARWLAFLDAPRFGVEAVKMLSKPGVLANGTELTYAFGLDRTAHRGHELIGHDGSHAGYRTYVGRVPDQRLGVIVLGNMASFDPCAAAFALIDAFPATRADVRSRAAFEPDPVLLASLVGGFERVGGGYSIGFELEDDQLVARFAGQRTALRPLGADSFWLDVPCTVSGPVSFLREHDGSVERGFLFGAPIERSAPGPRWSPDEEELAAYEGRYRSDELDTTYVVHVDEGTLRIRRSRDDLALTPRGADSFDGPTWFMRSVEFERDEDGAVAGLRVNGSRAFHVAFARLPR